VRRIASAATATGKRLQQAASSVGIIGIEPDRHLKIGGPGRLMIRSRS